MDYEIVEYEYMGMKVQNIKTVNDAGEVMWIPIEPGNSDYEQYLIDTDSVEVEK